MKHLTLLSLLVVLTLTFSFGQSKLKKVDAQKSSTQKIEVKTADFFSISEPLSKMAKESRLKINEQTFLHKPNKNKFPEKIVDDGSKKVMDPLGIKQRAFSTPKAETLVMNASFGGADASDNSSGIAPPDTHGDVSPDYYVQMINNVTSIYDKNGNTVTAPFNSSAFWAGFSDGVGGDFSDTNDGDPIVLWDETAGTNGRWLVSQFAVPHSDGNYYMLVAISQTDDPTGSYYRYAFQYPHFNDYPKIGIWPDAYYCGQNAFDETNGNASLGIYVSAWERDEMIAGNPAARMVNIEDASEFAVFPADADVLPPLGTPGIFINDMVATYTGNDEVYIYEFNVDWVTTSNSTFGRTQTITVSPYGFLVLIPKLNNQEQHRN